MAAARRSSEKRALLASYLLVLVIPLFLSLGGYLWTARMAREQATGTYRDLLRQVQSGVEGTFGELENLAQTMVRAAWVQKLAYMQGGTVDYSRMDRYELSQLPSDLATIKSLGRFIGRLALVFNQKDLVMTDTTIDTIDWFFSHAWVVDGMTAASWRVAVDSWSDGTALPATTVRYYPRSSRVVPWVRTLPLMDKTPRVTLLVGVREEALRALFGGVTGIPGASAFITDASGAVLASFTADPGLVKAVAARAWPDGHMESIADARGTGYFAFRTRAADSGRSYTAVIPASVVMRGTNFIKYATVALFILTLAAGVALAWAQWRRSYRPLEGIVERLSAEAGGEGADGGEAVNEYAFIERAVQRILTSSHDLERKVEWYMPMAMHSFFLYLLYDVMRPEQLPLAAETMGIPGTASPWTVAVIYRDDPRGAPMAQKTSRWIMAGNRPLYLVQVDASRLALVMSTDSRADVGRAVEGVRATLGIDGPLVGIGSPCSGLDCLHRSFREALTAVNSGVLRRDGAGTSMVYFEDLGSAGAEIVFPAAREEELLNKARMGDFGPVQELLDSLVHANAPVLGSPVAMHCFFYNLLSTALKAAEGTGLSISDLADERRIMALAEPREMKAELAAIFSRICAATAARREGRAIRARADILRSIDEGCLDKDLSLRVVAERFGVSVPYLSRFVKEQTGENFVEYVARRRIARAKEMLAAGSATIEQVSQKVGYPNPLTFRRAFKKYEGVNPGDYRGSLGGTRPVNEGTREPSVRI